MKTTSSKDFDLYVLRDNLWYEAKIIGPFKIEYKKTKKKVKYPK